MSSALEPGLAGAEEGEVQDIDIGEIIALTLPSDIRS